MELQTKVHGSVVVVKPDGNRIDASQSAAFKSQMVDLMDKGHVRIVLDLSAVTAMDSGGLGALISCLKALGDSGTLAVCGLQGSVERLFNLTKMNRVFQVFGSPAEAIAGLDKR